MIVVITTIKGQKYWAKSYSEDKDFIILDSMTKRGKKRNVKLNKAVISEIAEMEGDFDSNKK